MKMFFHHFTYPNIIERQEFIIDQLRISHIQLVLLIDLQRTIVEVDIKSFTKTFETMHILMLVVRVNDGDVTDDCIRWRILKHL